MNLTFVNSLQTILSVVNVGLIALLTQIGCADDPMTPSAELVCTASGVSWLPLSVLIAAATVSNFLKLFLLPWLSPGGWVHNLFGAKAVVVSSTSTSSTAGTVAPKDVR